MNYKDALKSVTQKFTSGNDIEVESATVDRKEMNLIATELRDRGIQLQSLITANNAYINAVSKCGVNSSQEISASNQMKIATEAASRFIEGG